MYVAVPPDRDPESVRVFGTFTSDLRKLVEWLQQCGITTVAMESTGVYWIPLYQMLEAAGIRACLVNARGLKNVPGRRTDWHDCQWLQYLHSVGLLRAAFRPEPQVCAVRSVWRQRSELVAMAAQHVQHMHKALTQMNLQIHHVINDITGVTGLSILDAILAGERDPDKLAELREPTIRASPETIRESLRGDWRREHLFVLRQSRRMYQSYREQIIACDREIEAFAENKVSDVIAVPRQRHNSIALEQMDISVWRTDDVPRRECHVPTRLTEESDEVENTARSPFAIELWH